MRNCVTDLSPSEIKLRYGQSLSAWGHLVELAGLLIEGEFLFTYGLIGLRSASVISAFSVIL